MLDEDKTKEQLIAELQNLRALFAEAEENKQDLEQAVEALEESERKFRLLYDQAPVAYQSLDGDANLIEVNQAWLDILGYRKEEVLGKNFTGFLLPASSNRFRENFPKFKAAGRVRGLEFDMVKKDGSTILVSLDGRTGRTPGGHFKQTHCVFEDITERVRQQQEIILLNRLYKVLSQVSQAVVRAASTEQLLEESCRAITEEGGFLLSWVGCVEASSKRVVPMASCGAASKYTSGIVMYFDERPEGLGAAGRCIREERPFVHNDFLKDSTTKPWHEQAARFGIKAAAGFPIHSEGRVWGALGVYSDEINSFGDKDVQLLEKVAGNIGFGLDNLARECCRKQAEAALGESERTFRNLFNNSAVGMFRTRSDGSEILNVNEKFLEIFGLAREEVIGKPSEIHWAEPSEREEMLHGLKTHGRVVDFECKMLNKDGEVRNCITSLILYPEEGILDGSILDVTKRKRAEQELANSLQRLDLATRAAGLGIWDRDIQKNELVWDERMYDLYGIRKEDFSGTREAWLARVHPDDRTVCEQFFQSALLSQGNYSTEFKILWPDGAVRVIRAYGKVVRDDEGNPLRMSGINYDITQQKEAEEALSESELKYRLLAENVSDVIFTMDLNLRITYVSPSVEKMHGWTVGEWRLLEPADYLPPASLDLVLNILSDELARNASLGPDPNRVTTFELEQYRKDGTTFWTEVSAHFLYDEHGEPVGFIGTVRDIAKRRAADDALRNSELRLRTILQTANEGFWLIDNDAVTLDLNPKMCAILGRSREEILGRKIFDFVDQENKAVFEQQMAVRAKGESGSYEIALSSRDGSKILCRFSGTALLDESGNKVGSFAMASDITDRRRAEDAVRESELELRQIIDLVPHKIFVKDWDGTYLLVNRAVAEGYNTTVSGITGKNQKDFHSNEDELKRMLLDDRGVMEKGQTRFIKEEAFTNAKGQLRFHQATKVPFRVLGNKAQAILGISVDITERKEAEEEREQLRVQLTQAQKMEAVGRLAGGVAHDFNNMLGVIMGYTEMALNDLDPAQPLYADLQEIQGAAERSADLTRQLLAFARKQTISPKVLDLNETVEGMLKMLRRLIGEHIDLAWFPAKSLPPVKVDPSQVDQILANLCVNARDAISGVGKVTIETGTTFFDKDYCSRHPGFVPGEFAMLAVSDNGCGMDKETLGRVFEPFFTTKAVGEGTGLGLATVYGIVKQNNGFINAYSEPGQGTTFKIYLPRTEEQTSERLPVHLKKDLRGKETVLLVEDEGSILTLGRTMLQRHGYEVLATKSPTEALGMVQTHPGPIHLLITDVVMPEMNGKDLRDKIAAMKPDLKSIFMSGYTANFIAHHGILDGGIDFLQKPFLVQTLLEKVRDVLDR